MNVALVYDLRDDHLAEGAALEDVAEFDSVATIEALEKALAGLGHRVERVGHGRSLCRRLADGQRWDLVFNIAEGRGGRSREAQAPALLEMFGVPYTFSDPLVCAATLDKAVAKRLAREAGLPTPPFALVATPEEARGIGLRPPLFAKPVAEGTGKGVDGASRVNDLAVLPELCGRLLARFRQPVLVEEYLPGREFTAGVLGTGSKARVLGLMEIRVRPEAAIGDYAFDVKEKCETLVDYLPVEQGGLRRQVEKLALDAYRVLECRDAGRVDVRLDAAGRPSFLEINPLPGLHPLHSDLPMIAAMEGWPYARLIAAIVASAAERTRP